MKQLFPLSCLLLGFFSAYFNGSAAESYSIGARSLANCSKGTSGCSKKYLMYPFPRVGRSEAGGVNGGSGEFPRSSRAIGIVKQPRVGRSDPSLLQLPDSQRIYDADDQADKADFLDYHQRGALAQREDYSRKLDNYLAGRRSMSPWAFFLITPNFHNSEHATMDNLILPQLDHQLDSRANDE